MHNFIQDRAKTFGVPEDGFLGRLAKVVTETDFLQVTAGAIFPSPMKPFFANIEHILVAPRMRKRIAELTEWIVWKAYSATAMEKYQEFEQSQRKAARLSEGVDFDDVRIREFSRAEMDSVMSYMSMGTEVVLLRDMIEVCLQCYSICRQASEILPCRSAYFYNQRQRRAPGKGGPH